MIQLEGTDTFKRKVERDSFAWNTAGGLVAAFQSVIMTMLIMRMCDIVAAGIFTIAYANAMLFVNIGEYGMRQFQVSDRRPKFSFADYLSSRVVTTTVMLIAGIAYMAIASVTIGYSFEKAAVIVVVYLLKTVDSIEDIYHGNYQQYGRLDVGAFFFTIRMAAMIIVFAIAICVSHDLLVALSVATVFTTVFFIIEVICIKRRHSLPQHDGPRDWRAIITLLRECFPLFLGAFLLFYISNAPRYAIDAFLDDTTQAYYGFIAMPTFFVGLLASFVYNPMIASLSNAWAVRDKQRFLRGFGRICLTIVGIALACILLAWLWGVPALNLLYNTNVIDYRNELTVLVAGGAFYAFTTLATLGLAIIRRQNLLIGGYVIVAIATFGGANYAVPLWGITGATWAYFLSMLTLAAIFGACFVRGATREPSHPGSHPNSHS